MVIVVAGARDSSGDPHVWGPCHTWVHKADASGTGLWTRTFDPSSGDDYGAGIATDSANNVLIVGYTDNGDNDDIWVFKLAP